MDIANEFNRVRQNASAAEEQSFYNALKARRASEADLQQITSTSQNDDEIRAAYRLLDLISANKNAGLSGDELYLEHDSVEDWGKVLGSQN